MWRWKWKCEERKWTHGVHHHQLRGLKVIDTWGEGKCGRRNNVKVEVNMWEVKVIEVKLKEAESARIQKWKKLEMIRSEKCHLSWMKSESEICLLLLLGKSESEIGKLSPLLGENDGDIGMLLPLLGEKWKWNWQVVTFAGWKVKVKLAFHLCWVKVKRTSCHLCWVKSESEIGLSPLLGEKWNWQVVTFAGRK